MPEPQTTGRLWALGVSREREGETRGAHGASGARREFVERQTIHKNNGGRGERGNDREGRGGLVTTGRAP